MARRDELDALRRAVALSVRALGRTSPNPPVGAVVLDTAGQVVGEGWTSPPGGPHAEVVALAEAGARAAGGTLVVTLEPCRHTGRTAPCTSAVIEAGIARVVVACADPTTDAGGGAQVLRESRVDVEIGLLAEEVARGPLEAWLTSQALGRPFVTWKYAATLDGRSAAADGTSRWITGEPARADVHRLRAECDAVVVGVGTVLADDPQLDVRPDPGRQPLRVIVDSTGRTPLTAHALAGPAPAVVARRTGSTDPGFRRTMELPPGADGRVDLPALLHRLAEQHDVVSVLLEGGPTLAGAFVAAGLVDRVVGYVAPVLLGDGPCALAAAGVGTISAAHRLRLDEVTRLGDDVRLTLRPRRT
ncbi:MAG: bifunctional diaminohydroxyphosphoribosylaminopyrimidine deaminase/5-amino-6-(5-phosphoribosylamino)uracil reductase RibD [Actinomycetota bacterium]|nr:bifunctional diaminohydroxyphosphoribosylaminopyrimidine deaminase/5-amino-6-(5-phosphoribosylamino)uracil reductase RibD [Actinomycetota bacterium]